MNDVFHHFIRKKKPFTLGSGPTFYPGILMVNPDHRDFSLALNYWIAAPQLGKLVSPWKCFVLSLKSGAVS